MRLVSGFEVLDGVKHELGQKIFVKRFDVESSIEIFVSLEVSDVKVRYENELELLF